MKIRYVDNSNFKSNFYHIHNVEREGRIDKISTNNSENLGNEPVLITDREMIPMDYDGKHYTAKINFPAKQYKIFYKDTGKFENNGNAIQLDEHKLSKVTFVNDLINTKQPLQKNISKGIAEGKLITDIDNIPRDEAVILLLGDIGDGYDLVGLPKNVQGIIVSDGEIDRLSHIAALSRSYYNMLTILYDEKKYNELLSLNNKYLSISNLNGQLKYSEIERPNYIAERSNITIPKITENDILLNYSQLNNKNSGNKAYRIALMQTLKYEGILKNIEIPKGFYIPTGYINNIENYLKEAKTEEERQYREFENPYNLELKEKCESLGIEPSKTIMRSAFNAEDLFEYPSAGLYTSECCHNFDEFVLTINNIVKSKNSAAAVESRRRYNIPDSIIQPAALLQEYIKPDYTFTAYTDRKNQRVDIDFSVKEAAFRKIEPAKIVYDSKNGNSRIIKHQIYNNKFITDKNGNILEKTDGSNPIAENWAVLSPLIAIIGSNALELEKILSRRQDIEGGIKDGKVYLWQARDIVKIALKRF